ncbi:MAG: hypothetical protein AAGI23_00330 [Bacteroidota bacterium]
MAINKTRKIVGWVLSALPAAAVTFSAFGKLAGLPEVTEALGPLNINPTYLAILALASVATYLYPKTSNIGFFLLCSYFGGVIVGESSTGEFPAVGIAMSVFLYVGTMLRKPELSGLGI